MDTLCSKIVYGSLVRDLSQTLSRKLRDLVNELGLKPEEAIELLRVFYPTALQQALASLELQKNTPPEETTGQTSEPAPDEPPRVSPPAFEASSESKEAPDAVDAILNELEQASTTIIEALQRGANALTPTPATRQKIEAFSAKIQGGVDSFLSKVHQALAEDKPQADNQAQPGDKSSSPPDDPSIN